jgi:hypothetical protein
MDKEDVLLIVIAGAALLMFGPLLLGVFWEFGKIVLGTLGIL